MVDNIGFRPTELMQNINIEMMRKSMDIQERTISQTLNSLGSLESGSKISAQTTGKGLNFDMRA